MLAWMTYKSDSIINWKKSEINLTLIGKSLKTKKEAVKGSAKKYFL